jgi:uncharacterized protein (UPF0332 family)
MTERIDVAAFLRKAEQSLAGAESELAAGRYDNCANRAYYACFQAAVAALLRAGLRPTGKSGRWSHDVIQASFAEQLVNRRKLYPAALRNVLGANMPLRHSADYDADPVSEIEAARAVRRAREFVAAVRAAGGPS